MNRTPWDGAFNLSDLGGMPLRAGGQTRQGQLYRSGAREYMSLQGWEDALVSGLTTVVDLRNPGEIKRERHHPVIDEKVLEDLLIVNLPTEDPDDEDFMRVCGPLLDHTASYRDNLAFYPEKFAQIFRTIAHAEGAVLFHCAGGRDRTGMIAAVLLALAGVPAEVIASDYERAVRGVDKHARRNPTHSKVRVHSIKELEDRIAERRTELITWLAGFDPRSYLREAGLSQEDIELLKSRLRPAGSSGA